MSIIANYRKGTAEAAVRPKTILLLWLVNLAFAFPVYLLFSTFFGAAVGRSGAAQGLMTKLDMNVLFEVLTTSGRPLGLLISGIMALLLLYFLATIFLQGGVLQGLLGGAAEARSGKAFFEGGARFYGRFFRLTVLSLILWIPAAAVFAAVSAVVAGLTGNSTNEQLSFYLTIGLVLFAAFLIYAIKMILDYARIHLATEDSSSALRALGAGVRFVIGHPGGTLGLYYLLGLTGLAILVVVKLIAGAIPARTNAEVWAIFVIVQLGLLSRGWLWIAYQSAQLSNYRSRPRLML